MSGAASWLVATNQLGKSLKRKKNMYNGQVELNLDESKVRLGFVIKRVPI
jgi:hypothetical protein